ncbi:MAG: D-Ala-D-Ala carboxypeptidase family metallohydrolase [Parachlamydiaceae bacterium]
MNPFYSEDKVSSIRRGEYISRMHDEKVIIPSQEKKEIRPYPWKCLTIGNYPKITKEHFRCKGCDRNPDKYIEQGNGVVLVKDCGGIEQHSLPLRENKEFIYPILIHLLNYVQLKLEKPVVITSGHRCPDHNRYNDPLPKSQFSKHMVGGEVSFYVRGLEEEPEKVIALLQEYFQENEEYQGQLEYLSFKRWERSNTDVSTQPWYNKEIFIKLYKAIEGRNFDNSHSYPYIAIQVRYDRALKENVSYSWDKAFRTYWRW